MTNFINKTKKEIAQKLKSIPNEQLRELRPHFKNQFEKKMAQLVYLCGEIEVIRDAIPAIQALNSLVEKNELLAEKDGQLKEITKSLIELGTLNKEQDIIPLLSHPENKNEVISDLFHAYLKLKDFHNAEKVVREAAHLPPLLANIVPTKDQLFKELIIELIKNDHYDQPQDIFNQLSSKNIKIEVMAIMTKELVKKKKYDLAHRMIITTIKDHPDQKEYNQSHLLKTLALYLFEKKDFENAIKTAELIQNKKIKSKVLSKVPHSH